MQKVQNVDIFRCFCCSSPERKLIFKEVFGGGFERLPQPLAQHVLNVLHQRCKPIEPYSSDDLHDVFVSAYVKIVMQLLGEIECSLTIRF